MERGTWKWDEKESKLVPLAQADAEEERKRREKFVIEPEYRPGNYL